MKKIQIKKISVWITLAVAILLLAIGVALLILNPEISVTIAVIAEVILIALSGISEVIESFKDKRKKEAVVRIIIYSALIAFILLFSLVFLTALNILYAIVALVLFVIRVLICVHMVKFGDGKHVLKNAVCGFFCLAFGVIMLILPPESKIAFLVIVVGIFFILYSLNYFGDFFAAISKADMDANRKIRRIHFALPNLFTAGSVNDVITECKQLMKEHPDASSIVMTAKEDASSKVNFEVLVHVANTIGGSMGHIDICIEDTVYSYGGYDEKTKILGGLFGGGTFFSAPKKPYINNCIKNTNKYIFGYGCVLSDSQIEAAMARVHEMIAVSNELTLEEALKQDRNSDDYLLAILGMGGRAYLVQSGEYKRYFGLGTNCVSLANTIMGRVGFDDLSYGSLKTPGAYLCMLETMLYRENTRVIQGTAYVRPDESTTENENK